MAATVTTKNKTETKTIKYRIEEPKDAMKFMSILAKNGYWCVLSADEEEGEDHGHKDNNRGKDN